MAKQTSPNSKPFPKFIWFIVLYLSGLGTLTIVAMLLKTLLSGL